MLALKSEPRGVQDGISNKPHHRNTKWASSQNRFYQPSSRIYTYSKALAHFNTSRGGGYSG